MSTIAQITYKIIAGYQFVFVSIFDITTGDPANGNNITVAYTQTINGLTTSNTVTIPGMQVQIFKGEPNPNNSWVITSQSGEPNPSPPVNQCDLEINFITVSVLIKNYTSAAPAVYQRCINKILNKNSKSNMNMDNQQLIEKTTSVLDKLMNYFKKVVNKQTITDKGTLHHAGEMDEGAEVYQDADMTTPAATDTYTTASGSKIAVKGGQVQKVTPPLSDPDADPDPDSFQDDDDDMPSSKFKKTKTSDVQSKIQSIRAKLHAQNALLSEAQAALQAANTRLSKTREEVKNEIRSNFTPEGSKRSNKAKTEQAPFFAPTSTLAKNAVKKAISK